MTHYCYIYFDAVSILGLAIRGSFRLVPMSPSLYEHFVTQKDILCSSDTSLVPEPATSPRSPFLLPAEGHLEIKILKKIEIKILVGALMAISTPTVSRCWFLSFF